MALFNKLFTRHANPYEIKGRWYKTEIVNDAIVSSDFPSPTLYASGTTQYLMIGKASDYKILQYIIDCDMQTPSSSRTFDLGYRVATSGNIGVAVSPLTSIIPYGKQTIYILAERV